VRVFPYYCRQLTKSSLVLQHIVVRVCVLVRVGARLRSCACAVFALSHALRSCAQFLL